ncbi:MAG: response regulator [Candidatus Omnitrophica bacterium]|nr:response regulator [Candidatus Omnitrophota bacterium]
MSNPLIYVIDDQINVGEIITLCLRMEGYRADFFANPLLAIAAFNSADPKPFLLISDFSMREMDGIELQKRCRALMPNLKTIMISGTVTREMLEMAQPKPDRMFEKPVNLRELVSTISSLLAA